MNLTEKALTARLEAIGGCGDSSCIVAAPKEGSVCTNGGCRCVRDPAKMTQVIHALKMAVFSQSRLEIPDPSSPNFPRILKGEPEFQAAIERFGANPAEVGMALTMASGYVIGEAFKSGKDAKLAMSMSAAIIVALLNLFPEVDFKS